ncbi:hypothetical protein ACLB9Y_04935 [Chryseobacterium scophthalmum]|uniref:hypothetical protein n=1 Tax=Chryseobacterium scophthalmum TaxID=59733 RepID=UPI00398A7AA4
MLLLVIIDFYNELLKNNIKGIVPIKVLNSVSKSFGKKKSELPVFVHFAFIPSNVENIPIAYDLQDKSPTLPHESYRVTFFNTLSKSFYLYENVIDELSL